MAKHSVPRATRTASGEVILVFPYSAGLVADIKNTVPHHFRDYSPSDKTWLIAPPYADLAIDLLLRHYPDAESPRPAGKARQTPAFDAGSDPFRVLHLRPTAPVELIEGAYRVLSRLHHPDTGGDVLEMQRINAAYGALKARVSA